MRTSNWKIFIFIIILTFGLMFNAVYISYSQGDDYLTSYFPIYYSTWLFSPSDIQTLTNNHPSLYAMSLDAPLDRSLTTDDLNMFYTQPKMFEGQSVHYGGMMYGYNGSVDGVQDGVLFLRNDALITNGIFNQISGNYQSMVNPVALFNHPYAYLPIISGYQSPKLSIQKCLRERPDLDTSQCKMFHRDPSLSVSAGNSIGYSLGFPPNQLSAIPSTDYLSLYFICFEGSEFQE